MEPELTRRGPWLSDQALRRWDGALGLPNRQRIGMPNKSIAVIPLITGRWPLMFLCGPLRKPRNPEVSSRGPDRNCSSLQQKPGGRLQKHGGPWRTLLQPPPESQEVSSANPEDPRGPPLASSCGHCLMFWVGHV